MKKILLFFAILSSQVFKSQTITLTQPNGGETLYACQTYTVKWTQTGSPSNYWNIDYSLDGGIIWTSVASNYLSANGQFVWTVPNVQSNIVLMRVKDALNSSTVDQSDNFFAINTAITVTAPDGGEVLPCGTVKQITWNSFGTSNSYTIRYSTNNGSTWTTIVAGYATASNTYNWTVPCSVPSNSCLVEVYDALAFCTRDPSNATFTISPPVPLVSSPNGGEVLNVSCNTNITWPVSRFFSTVNISYSTDNGASWTAIVTNSTNDGTESWTVPNTPSTQALIKIANYADPTIFDVSNAPFTIKPPVTVLWPNGGEVLNGCDTYTINWSKSTCVGPWDIRYSINNGASWTTVATGITDNGLSTQSYTWTVPETLNSLQGLIRVQTYANSGAMNDASDAVFTFDPSDEITVLTPTLNANLNGGQPTVITWSVTPNTSGVYNIQYYNGTTVTTLTTTATGTSYTFTPANVYPTKTNCWVRIYDANNICKNDQSDLFTVTYVPPVPLVSSPNGGEVLNVSCNTNITWPVSRFFSTVNISYSTDNGASWTAIVTNSTNDGTESWTVPNTPSTQALIKIANYADPTIFDVSNAPFTIKPPVTVLWPNGGEVLNGCDTYTINWSKSTCVGPWDIRYSINNGASWTTVATGITDNGLSTQSYTWTVPETLNSLQGLIRVQTYANSGAMNDASDAVFTFDPSDEITVLTPTLNANLNGGQPTVITWSVTPNTSGVYNIQYYNGTTVTTLTTTATGTSYTFTPANVYPTKTNCWVRIYDANNICKNDQSDLFTVTYVPPVPLVSSPNGGEVLNVSCNTNITWPVSRFFSTVNISYSIDNGASWTAIVTNSTNDGTESWTVPNTPSTQALIKIANYADPTIFDVSNAPFTIKPPVTVLWPNGGEVLNGCDTYTINWSKSTCVGPWDIRYSINNGASWTTVATGITDNGLSTQSYTWTVPETLNSLQGLIRVQTYANSGAMNDASDAVFTFDPSDEITVLTPTLNANLNGGQPTVITWSVTPNTSGVYNIQYYNGTTVTTLTTTATGTSYTFTPANVYPTKTNCWVRIYDANNICKNDQSDLFTVTYVPPVPLVSSPNGGEVLNVSCNTNITWPVSRFFSTVNISYSIDNGASWTAIVTNSTNDGTESWTVPNTPSTQALIKIANYADPTIFDVSNAPFTIKPPVTVLWPNGGEVLNGCDTYTINWSKSTCVGPWDIRYSINNGASWTTVATGITDNGLSTQSYTWTVPETLNSLQGLIRVQTYANSGAMNDASDAVFTFDPSDEITVLTPTLNANLNGGQPTVITWSVTPNTSGVYNIQYYNGTTVTTLTTTATGTSYTFTPANVYPTKTNCWVRIYDANNICKNDQSDLFTVTYVPPVPLVSSPNGGEVLNVSCNTNITWPVSRFFSTVNISYSIDNGASWTAIVTNSTNDGTESWTVPNTPSTQALIKIANYADPTIFDVSNAPFTIKPPVTVLWPNGGEVLNGCDTYTINWSKSTCVGPWDIRYSINNGASWTTVATGITDNGLSTQSYTWTVPETLNSLQGLIRVQTYANSGAMNDASDAVFTFDPSDEITVLTPTLNANLNGGQPTVITWSVTPNTSGVYNIQYYNGTTVTTLTTTATGTSYTFTPANVYPTKTNCWVRIYDANNICKNDQSDLFTVNYVPPTPLLLLPNGGESLYAGTNYTITWNTSRFYSTLNLYYSLDNGVTWTTIVTNTANDGSEVWTLPAAGSTTCLVKAANYPDPTLFDVSDAVFTIKPPVTVLTPNGDNGVTIWGGCTVTSLTFDRSPAWNNYKIEYSLNNGASWTQIVASYNATVNPATYNWNLPNYATSGALVRVTPVSVAYSDQSDAPFTITKPVTIIQPNFGGIMQSGTVYPIKWSSDGISNIYDLYYSINGGASFTTIITGYNTSVNTYSWTVPATVSNNCKILVKDNINSCKRDTSDQAFIIQATPPAITLLSPNGGDSLKGCSTYMINWTDAQTTDAYDISYSTNAGTSWTSIVSNYTTSTHDYAWVVPNTITSPNVLLRVQSASTVTAFDLSDALLTIVNGTLSATPSYTAICDGTAVQLSASGGVNYNWSPAGSLSSASIANPVATPSASVVYTVQSVNGSCILSDTVRIAVSNSGMAAGVAITASPTNSICPGTAVTFSASPLHGGLTPGYAWYLNGTPTGVSTATYSSASLAHNDAVTCIMTSGLSCVSNNPATSNAIVMDLSSGQTPSVSILASPSNTICPSMSITFSASPVFGGTAPVYAWRLNGTLVSTNSFYVSNSPVNGNTVTLTMTSNASCVTSATASAAPMVIVINTAPAAPAAISGSTVVCANNTYIYTASPVAGATAYVWTLPSGWSGTSTSNTISVTTGTNAGSLTVRASNACGTGTARILSVSIGAPGVTISGPSSVCFGSSATFTAGGSATSFTWSTAQTGSVIAVSPTITSTYTVTGADPGGCQNTAVKTITVTALPTVAAGSPTICGGTTATITASGASTYTWNTGATGVSLVVSPSSTTNYTVTGTSSAGCVNTRTTSVTVTPGPVITVSNATICAGTSTILTASGVTTYTWNTGAVSSTLSVSPSSTATYAVSGGNPGCSGIAMKIVTVTVNALPTVGITGSSSLCSGQSNFLTATGTATSYSWSTGQTTSSISVSPTVTTTYSLTGTNAMACTATAFRTITVNITPTITVMSQTICGGSSATLTASGASTYTWNTGATGANLIVTPAITTYYSVNGTAASGCVNTATASVTVGAAPSITVNSATVCAGSSATLTASGVSTYTWSTGATGPNVVVTPAATTVYTVSGNLSGCSTTVVKTATVSTNAPVMAITASNASICNGQSTTLSLSGSATSYTWSTGQTTASISVSPTVITTYSATGLSVDGCSNTAALTVTVNALPAVSASTASVCLGGTVALTASGASTYTWNTGATGASLSVSPSTLTDYTVSGTSAAGCISSATTQVSVGPVPSIAVNSATVCAGTAATLTANGATTYTWSTTAPGPTLVVSPASTTVFTVSGTSAGCHVVAMNTATVTVNALPAMSISGNTSLCSGQSTSLTVNTSAISYTWSTGQTQATIAVSPGSTTGYSVSGIGSNGCSATASATVSVNPIPTIGVSNATICAGGSTTLTANGAIAYTWNTGAVGASCVVSPTTSASYTVTGMGIGGCMNTAVASVVVTASPSVSVNSGTICSGNTMTLTASGASTYTWSTGQQAATIIVSPGTSTLYTVTGEIPGCTVYPIQTATVVVNISPNVTAGSSNTLICAGETATLSALGATTYSWSTAQTGSVVVVSPVSAMNYTVTGSSPEGCKDEAVISLSVSPCTGIAGNNNTNLSIGVYPNPFTEVFTIHYAEQENDEVTVLNALGALVYQARLTAEKTEIALPYEAGGIYFLQIKTRYGVVIQKIVKE